LSTEPATAGHESIARSFVAARLAARALADFPGALPPTLDAAYDTQRAAISLWPDQIAGWKVGWIAPAQQAVYGEERLVGPIFRKSVRRVQPGIVADFPVYVGGFAAVEAEYVFRLGEAAPAGKLQWTLGEASRLVAALHVGVEPASSPLPAINDLGPAVTASDFGNNAGLLVGPEVADWVHALDEGLTCETFVDGVSVGRGGSRSLPGGPLGALAFALGRCARNGMPLHAGDFVTTGAATGVHELVAGQPARIVFDGIAELLCRAVPARPVAAA
jgi:2-keto-4-pentenoate hydratase